MSGLAAAPAPSAPKLQQQPANPIAVMSNMATADYVRTWSIVASASAAGICGATGSTGFALYAAQHVVVALALLRLMKWRPSEFVPGASVLGFAMTGLADLPNVLTYVFFWTVLFAVVHIY